MFSLINGVGLGPHEGGREHHLVFDHQTIERQMVSTDLPTPGLTEGGLAKQGEVIAPFPKDPCVVGECSQELIDAHRVAGFFKTLGRQTALHES